MMTFRQRQKEYGSHASAISSPPCYMFIFSLHVNDGEVEKGLGTATLPRVSYTDPTIVLILDLSFTDMPCNISAIPDSEDTYIYTLSHFSLKQMLNCKLVLAVPF